MKMRRVLSFVLTLSFFFQLFAARVCLAQTFEPTVFLPPQPTIPNYGTAGGSVNWNLDPVSGLNIIIAEALAGNTNVDQDSAFVVNAITDNSAAVNKFGPLQNGVYLNQLVFQAELAQGVTAFGAARLQDEFNKQASFRVRDRHFKYDFSFTRLIDRVLARPIIPSAGGINLSPFMGYPTNASGLYPLVYDEPVINFPETNLNQLFYPTVDTFVSNSLRYTADNGLGFFASNRLRSQTGKTLYLSFGVQGPYGINNDLSDSAFGLDYTNPDGWQFYGARSFQNWNNKFQPGSGYIGLPTGSTFLGGELFMIPIDTTNPLYPGVGIPTTNTAPLIQQPCYPNFSFLLGAPLIGFLGANCLGVLWPNVPNYKQEDTFKTGDSVGLRVPVTKSASFSALAEDINRTSAGQFGRNVYASTGGLSYYVLPQTLIESTPGAGFGLIPTNLSPQVNERQYRGKLDWFLDKNNVAFLDFGYWEENPNSSVLHETSRSRNNVFGLFTHRMGRHSLSISGGWEQETVTRTIDFREPRIWDAFNPLVNTTFGANLGTAAFNGSTVTFTPNPGVSTPGFTTTIIPAGCLGASGCGVNTISYPVGGIINYPAPGLTPILPSDMGAVAPGLGFNPATRIVGLIPVVAPVGRQRFTGNTYTLRLRASGPVTENLDYRFSGERLWADRTLFRSDPQDQWKGRGELTWNPSAQIMMTGSVDYFFNQSNSLWQLHSHYRNHEDTENFSINYSPTSSVSFFAGYRNYTQTTHQGEPILNSGTTNFIGPIVANPGVAPLIFLPTVGTMLDAQGDLGLYATFDQYFACPLPPYAISSCPGGALNSMEDDVRIQDQEILATAAFRFDSMWSSSFSYARSRPQVFQSMRLVNPVTVIDPVNGAFSPNTPVDFYQAMESMELMDRVDGRKNSYSLSVSRLLPEGASVGFTLQLFTFKNLSNRITRIGIPCGAVATTPCTDGTPIGYVPYRFGPSLASGQVFSASISYRRRF